MTNHRGRRKDFRAKNFEAHGYNMQMVSEVLIDQMLITMGSHLSTFVASGGEQWLVASG